MTLLELARDLGISKEKCRRGIIDGQLPFATYIPPGDENEHYTFVILEERYEKWKRGEFVG